MLSTIPTPRVHSQMFEKKIASSIHIPIRNIRQLNSKMLWYGTNYMLASFQQSQN